MRALALAAVVLAIVIAPAWAQPDVAVDQVIGVSAPRAGNSAVIKQLSDESIVILTQQSGAPNGASATVTQSGSQTFAEIVQAGVGNALTLEQSGDGALAVLTQRGATNAMDVTQSAAGDATLTQLGNGNMLQYVQTEGALPIVVTQTDGATATISNGGP